MLFPGVNAMQNSLPSNEAPLTSRDLLRYLACPHWLYWERFGDPEDRRALPQEEEEEQAGYLSSEREIAQAMFGDVTTITEENTEDTLAAMQAGVPVIYRGAILSALGCATPTLLVRTEGRSTFGDWYYIPIDVRRAHALRKEHKVTLTFAAMILEQIQGMFPGDVAVVNRDQERLSVDSASMIAETQALLETVRRIKDGELPESVYRKACEDVSPWGKACFRLASAQDDIALIYNVDVKRLQSLRACNIRTVSDAADMDVATVETCATDLTARGIESAKRQAHALRDRVVVIREPFVDPPKGDAIYFDIESHPATDTDYLFGFLWNDVYLSFAAQRLEDEEQMWRAFLTWVETLPAEYTVYHYGDYERERLIVLSKRYATTENPWLQRFLDRMIDTKELVRTYAVLPLYIYSLKSICKFLGFSWRGDVANGRESVHFFDRWLATQNESLWQSLLTYNEDDVRATKFLAEWLQAYATEPMEYGEPYTWSNNKMEK